MRESEKHIKKQKEGAAPLSKEQIKEVRKAVDTFFEEDKNAIAIKEYERFAFLDLENHDELLEYALSVAEHIDDKSVGYASKNNAKNAAAYVLSKTTKPVDKAKSMLIMAALSYNNKAAYYKTATELYDIKKLREEYPNFEDLFTFQIVKHDFNDASKTPTVCFSPNHYLDEKFKYADFIKIEPSGDFPIKITKDNICISDLEYNKTYDITFLKGMPNAYGEQLKEDKKVSIITKNKGSKLFLQNDTHILLKNDEQTIPLSTINVNKVNVTLFRISDKSFNAFLSTNSGSVFMPQSSYISKAEKQIIFEGSMDIKAEKNANHVTNIPLQDMIKDLKPGLYHLFVEQDKAQETTYKESAEQWVLVTDLGLTTLKANDAYYVQARSYSTAEPLEGVEIHLISGTNEALSVLKTDNNGFVKFDAALLNGKGGDKPRILMAYGPDKNFNYLKLTVPAFDLTDRGVDGKTLKGDFDAFLYTEQGIYRPSSTIHLNALLGNYKGDALKNIPLTFKVLRPDGQVVEAQKITGDDQGHYALTYTLPSAARMGQWKIQAFIDPTKDPVGFVDFGVEDFVPSRLFVKLESKVTEIDFKTPYVFNLESNFLFGLPAAHLDYKTHIMVQKRKNPFPKFKDFKWGDIFETFENKRIDFDPKKLNDKGEANVNVILENSVESTFPLEAEVVATVTEESARDRSAKQICPIKIDQTYVGLKTQSRHPYSTKEVPVEVLTVDSLGNPVSEKLSFDVYLENPYFSWQQVDQVWRYISSFEEKFHEKGDIETNKDGLATFTFNNQGFNQYKLVIKNKDGKIVGSRKTEVGYSSRTSSHTVPDQLDILIDKEMYQDGDTILVNIKSPFDGQLLLTVAGSVIFENKNLNVKKGENTFKVKANKDWGNGVYLLATAMRPLDALSKQSTEDQLLPKRAIGVQWVKMNTDDKKLNVVFDAIPEMRSKSTLDIKLKVEGDVHYKTFVTIAAIDEGILFLTDYKTPDPYNFFFQKHQLGIELRDLYAKIMNPQNGVLGTLKSGGDAATLTRNLSALSKRTFKIVSLYQSPLEVGQDGKATVKFDIPEFNGTLRIMAIAYNEKAKGFGTTQVLVRDPVVIESQLPRFLRIDDEAQIGLTFHDVLNKEGTYTLAIEPTGPLKVGDYPTKITLPQDHQIRFSLKGTDAKDGEIKVTLKGEGIDPITQTIDISVLQKGNKTVKQHIQLVKPGEKFNIPDAFIHSFEAEGLEKNIQASFSMPWPKDTIAKTLKEYPYSCTEQITSKGLAETVLKNNDSIQNILATLSQRQNIGDDGFSLWTFGSSDPYLTAHVYQLLKQHTDKAETMATFAKQYLKNKVHSYYLDKDPLLRVYLMYVLADEIDPGQIRVFFDQNAKKLRTAYGKALLLNLCARIGDTERLKQILNTFNEQLEEEKFPYRSALANQLRTQKVLKEAAEFMPKEDFSSLIEQYSGFANAIPDQLSTQEAAAVLDLYGDNDDAPTLITDENSKNESDKPKWYAMTLNGVQKPTTKNIEHGIKVNRHFYSLKGDAISTFKKGDLVVIVLDAEIKSPLTANGEVIFVNALPAGFEHEKYILEQKDKLPWHNCVHPVVEQKMDDKYVATFTSNGLKTVKVAFVVRATFDGQYECPSFVAEDMFNPSIYGKTSHSTITIEPAK